jgi:hypothetical protein
MFPKRVEIKILKQVNLKTNRRDILKIKPFYLSLTGIPSIFFLYKIFIEEDKSGGNVVFGTILLIPFLIGLFCIIRAKVYKKIIYYEYEGNKYKALLISFSNHDLSGETIGADILKNEIALEGMMYQKMKKTN